MQEKRSLFGPLLLIATGVMWFLIQSGNVPSGNLWALTHIWPFLLIAAGIGVMLKPYWKYTSMILDVLIVGGIMLAIIFAPKLGWDNPSIFSFVNNREIFTGPGVRGSGNVMAETREASDFNAVSVEYPAKVLITQGSVESVRVEAEDNLLPDLKTQVRNGTLEIFYKKTNETHVNPTKPVTITITVKDLAKVDFSSAGEIIVEGLEIDKLDISLNGAGRLDLNDIHTEDLSVSLSGAGSMTASGTTDKLDLDISGFGDFKGAELHGITADIAISGAGSATVWVDDRLEAEISGAGSVNYYGTAEVTRSISGIGTVNHQGNK